MCVHKSGKRRNKMKNIGKNGVFEKKLDFEKILIFYLLRQVIGCFGPGVEEQVGEEPLGERP